MQINKNNQPKGNMSRIRLNSEYRNKIANRMRVHLEQEDTQEKQKYDELKSKLNLVLKGAVVSVSSQTDDLEDDAFVKEASSAPEVTITGGASTDDGDAMSYFAKLADED